MIPIKSHRLTNHQRLDLLTSGGGYLPHFVMLHRQPAFQGTIS